MRASNADVRRVLVVLSASGWAIGHDPIDVLTRPSQSPAFDTVVVVEIDYTAERAQEFVDGGTTFVAATFGTLWTDAGDQVIAEACGVTGSPTASSTQTTQAAPSVAATDTTLPPTNPPTSLPPTNPPTTLPPTNPPTTSSPTPLAHHNGTDGWW